ncbi:MAG: SprT family zinc-dependent metalloprotease [Methanobacteriota archaeon]
MTLKNTNTLELSIRPGNPPARREATLTEWYRTELKTIIPGLIERWESILGVCVSAWGVRKMKTKWGSCNPASRRILLNLELVKKPLPCIEYIVLHEMLHLIERHHNDAFHALLTQYMPKWRLIRDELNRAPLAHEKWKTE